MTLLELALGQEELFTGTTMDTDHPDVFSLKRYDNKLAFSLYHNALSLSVSTMSFIFLQCTFGIHVCCIAFFHEEMQNSHLYLFNLDLLAFSGFFKALKHSV